MIKKLTLQNFGPFDICNIDLAPLTLLAGYNYTGKSVVLKAIQGLSDWDLGNEDNVIDMDCMKRRGGKRESVAKARYATDKGEIAHLSLNYGGDASYRFYEFSSVKDNGFPKVRRLYHSRMGTDWLHNYKGVLLLENPEAFLHQSKQSLLGKALATRVAEGDIQIIIETHSEHVFNGIRIAIKQGVLPPDDFMALNFNISDEGIAHIERVPIDKAGGCDNWPDGFFGQSDVDYKELFGF